MTPKLKCIIRCIFFTLSVCTHSSVALEAALLLVRRNSKLLIEHNLELAAAPTTSFLLEAVSALLLSLLLVEPQI